MRAIASPWVLLMWMLALLGGVPAQGLAQAQEDNAGGERPAGPPPALVRVGSVETRTVQNHWKVVGRLREVRHAVVAAQQEGRVIEVAVEEGDEVVGGQTVLARTDDVWAQLEVDAARAGVSQAQAEVAQRQATLTNARRELAYLEELDRSGAARTKELDEARSTVEAEQAALERAEANVVAQQVALQRAAEQVERHTLKAPFDGVVVRKLTEVGQWLNRGGPVVEVISRGQVDAVLDVPERFVNHLSVGSPVEVMIEPLDRSVRGRLIAITPQSAGAARTFPVKVRIDDEHGALKAGMSVQAFVPTGEEEQHLTVPRDAVVRTPTGTAVWANMDGKAMMVAVDVRFGVGERYVIAPRPGGPPLRDGTEVVVEGAERLFPTQPLNVARDQPADQSANANR